LEGWFFWEGTLGVLLILNGPNFHLSFLRLFKSFPEHSYFFLNSIISFKNRTNIFSFYKREECPLLPTTIINRFVCRFRLMFLGWVGVFKVSIVLLGSRKLKMFPIPIFSFFWRNFYYVVLLLSGKIGNFNYCILLLSCLMGFRF
jgi:hypothetical protein